MTPATRISLVDLAKSAICFIASLAWIAIAIRLVSDTQTGVVTLAVPFFVVLGTALYFFARGMGRLLKGLLTGGD